MDATPTPGSTDTATESSPAAALDAEAVVSAPADASLPWAPIAMPAVDLHPFAGDGDSAPVSVSADAPAAPRPAEVDKIREILFGQQITDYEARLSHIEVRLAREVEAVRDEMVRRFEKLQSQLAQDVSTLTRQLATEQKHRTEEVATLNAQLRAARDDFKDGLRRTASEAEAATARVRESLDDEAARLQEAHETRTGDIERQLEAATAQLSRDKVDRSSLQALFEQLAVHFGSRPDGAFDAD